MKKVKNGYQEERMELDGDLFLILSTALFGSVLGYIFKKVYIFIATGVILIFMILNKIRPRYPYED